MTFEEHSNLITTYGGSVGSSAKVYFVNVTPALATEWLTWSIKKQRKINARHVAKLVRDIKNGNWKGDFIDTIVKITTTNKLINGQHRLTAIIESGISVTLPVMFNARESEFEYLDSGKSRFTRDFVTLKNASTVTALAKAVLTVKNRDMQTLGSAFNPRTDITQIEQIKFIEDYADELEKNASYGMRLRNVIGNGSPTLFAYFCWLLRFTERDVFLDEFIEDFARDVPNSKPVISCKTYLIKNLVSGKKTSGEYAEKYLGVLLNTYDKFVDGSDSTKVNYINNVLPKDWELLNEYKEKL